MNEFWEGYAELRDEFHKYAAEYFDNNLEDGIISQGIRYAFNSGGKRIRPLLLMECARANGVMDNKVMRFALALECIHCYSLVHDDMPCMDNDDERRGNPSVHIKFGEGNALLIGDSLLSFAYEIMLDDISSGAELGAIKALAYFSGVRGMIKGQAIDINHEMGKSNGDPDIKNLREKVYDTHMYKTAALIRGAIAVGAILASVDMDEIGVLDDFALYLGLSYQITDDILDDETEKDKLTYTNIYGVENSKKIAADYIQKAIDCIKDYGDKYSNFSQLIQSVQRQK